MLWPKAAVSLFLLSAVLLGQSNSYIDPTRPTISSYAVIQQKGVLQIESVGKERWARSGGHTYNWSQKTSLVTETYGQSVSVSAPPGAYQLAGFTRQLTKHFSLKRGLALRPELVCSHYRSHLRFYRREEGAHRVSNGIRVEKKHAWLPRQLRITRPAPSHPVAFLASATFSCVILPAFCVQYLCQREHLSAVRPGFSAWVPSCTAQPRHFGINISERWLDQ